MDNCTVIEMKARIGGVYTQQFEFRFGVVLDRNLLQHTDSLSVSGLQRKALSVADGLSLPAITIRTLKEHDSQ